MIATLELHENQKYYYCMQACLILPPDFGSDIMNQPAATDLTKTDSQSIIVKYVD